MKKTALVLALAVLMIFGTIASASAVDFPGVLNGGTGKWEAIGDVTVNATVNPKITLSLDQIALVTPVLDPDVAAPQWTAPVEVAYKTNTLCDLTKTVQGVAGLTGVMTPLTGGPAAPTLTTTLADQSGVRGNNSLAPFVDTYSISIDYTIDPGDYQATVQYTLVQQ